MKNLLQRTSCAGRKILAVLFLLSVWNHWSYADRIDIGIFESSTPGKIEVRIRPDFTIYGTQTITGILYTLRWTDGTIVITTLDNIAPFGVAFDGPPVLDEGYYYQKFWAVPMSPVGTPIPAGTERIISSFSYTGSDGAFFEIINDEWTGANNGDVYLELGGFDYTGIIYSPFAPDPCTISLTCPGDLSVVPVPGECGATVTYPPPVAGGDCSDVTIVQTAGLPSGSYFPSGTTTNSFLATTSEGPTASCSFTVTVNALPGPAGAITGVSQVCRGQTGVVYSVEPVTGATSYSWTYTGAGATINGNGNTVTIDFGNLATSGNLKVRGVNLCGMGPASPNFLITVKSVPGAAGTITGTSAVCQGQGAVSYSVSPIAFATGYVWTYSGTGATINGAGTSVTITFSPEATSGNLSVYGTNSCGNGTASPNFPVTVNPLPGPAGTITGPSAVCQGQDDVTYSIAAIPYATSYVWAYSGTGATIVNNGTTALVSFSLTATAGSLTVHGVNGCGNGTASPNFPVTVNPLPGPAGTMTGTTQVCQGQGAVSYSVSPIAFTTGYVWTYGGTGATINGAGTSVTVTFSPEATSGNLWVYGTNSCGNGTASPNFPVTVNPLPGPAGTITGPSAVCQGQDDVTYSIAAIPYATSYVWAYSGTGATIVNNGTTALVSFSLTATAGSLTVHGVNDCGNGAPSPGFAITVNALPLSPTSGGDQASCTGQSIPPLTVIVGAGETADWYADPDGGTPLASGTLAYTPIAAGTFYAQARNLATGCQSLSRTAVTLTIHPLPEVFAGADQSIPNGTTTTISDATASGTAPLIYSWAPASAFVDPGILHPTTVNLFLIGNYTLTVTDGNTCVKSDQMTIMITGSVLGVNPSAEPDALCAGEGAQLFPNASGGSGTYSYNWISDPVGFTSEEANPLVSPTVSTTYTVVVDDGYNTVTGSVTVTVILLEVTCPDDMEALLTDPPFALTGGLPAGGVYSGNGVTEGWFDPATAGNGEHIITYAYEDENGCTDLCTFLITVSGSALSGDANCDGIVNVLDIITIVNYIMGQNPSPFCFDEADTNDDLMINVLDIIGTVNVILAL
ncbi:MAG: HYR domain-containing protein [Bacteroidales bacterium]|nr:HYR domain-containing protein [Bacteroidales bacterium]